MDENNFEELCEPTIASQLPAIVPPSMQVIVTSRHTTSFVLDLDEVHPLKTCEQYSLAPLERGTETLERARREIAEFMLCSESRQILATIAISNGTLSAIDLEEILAIDRIRIRKLFKGKLARSVVGHSDFSVRPNAIPYSLAHGLIVEAVCDDLDSDETIFFRLYIHNWCKLWIERGWPDETPSYLIESYTNMLVSVNDVTRLSELLSLQRFELLRRRTAGDQTALGELVDATNLLAKRFDCDLLLLTRVSFLKMKLEERTLGIPPDYAIALARIGRVQEAIQLSRTMQNTYDRVDALLGVAESVMGEHPDEAAALAKEASNIPFQLEEHQVTNTIRAGLLQRKSGDVGVSESVCSLVRRFLNNIHSEYKVCDLLYPLSQFDPEYAANVLDTVIEKFQADVADMYCANASTVIYLGRFDSLIESLGGFKPEDRRSALRHACSVCFEQGGRSTIPKMLQESLYHELHKLPNDPIQWEVDELWGAKYLPKDLAKPLLKALIRVPMNWCPADMQVIGTSLASHCYDPREHVPGDWDEFYLSLSSSAARLSGYVELAADLATGIKDAKLRASSLSEVALAMIEKSDEITEQILKSRIGLQVYA